MQTNYYDRKEVSNSDLGALEKYFQPPSFFIDTTAAFRFGSLLDAMITEGHTVDLLRETVCGIPTIKEEWNKALAMKKVFFADPFCKALAAQCEMQKVSVKPNFDIEFEGYKFQLPMRAKWDFFAPKIDLSGDLKTTASTTQKQFEETIYHYNYNRQAALYMDLEGKTNFIFVGISKENHKIFKVPVKRGGEIYNSGKAKYQELAFQYHILFGDLKQDAA